MVNKTEKATFAAGCFWHVEDAFRRLKGVLEAVSDYTGGSTKNPGYAEVCFGGTGHAEAVQVTYDPLTISYAELLDAFWRMHDPTQKNRQGPDSGSQYRSMIFYHNEKQEILARESKQAPEKSGRYKNANATEIAPAGKFYQAEAYHQRYFEKRGKKACGV